jgi:hypothetical protein
MTSIFKYLLFAIFAKVAFGLPKDDKLASRASNSQMTLKLVNGNCVETVTSSGYGNQQTEIRTCPGSCPIDNLRAQGTTVYDQGDGSWMIAEYSSFTCDPNAGGACPYIASYSRYSPDLSATGPYATCKAPVGSVSYPGSDYTCLQDESGKDSWVPVKKTAENAIACMSTNSWEYVCKLHNVSNMLKLYLGYSPML